MTRRRLALSALALSTALTLAGCTPDLWFMGELVVHALERDEWTVSVSWVSGDEGAIDLQLGAVESAQLSE